MSGSGIQNTTGLNPMPVNNGLSLPPGINPSIIPLNVDMTVNQSVLVDFTQQVQGGHIGPIQTIFVNNSGNGQSVTIISNVLNQQYVIPAGDSAILPILLPSQSPKFTVNSTGGVVIPMAVMNFPLPAQVWGPSLGGAGSTTSGNLTGLNTYDIGLNPLVVNLGEGKGLSVYDLALQALISNQGAGEGLDVNVISGGGAGVVPNQIVVTGALNNGTTSLTGAASGAGLYWAITSLYVGMSPLVAKAAGGLGAVNFEWTGSSTIAATVFFDYPTVAGVAGPPIQVYNQVYDPPLLAPGLTNNTSFKALFGGVGAPDSGNFYINATGYPQAIS